MRTSALVILLMASAAPAHATSMQVTGKLGYLSEWEIAATVDEHASAGTKEFSGPLVLRHVGVCTPGRPVEMSGEIRYRITGWISPRMKATLLAQQRSHIDPVGRMRDRVAHGEAEPSSHHFVFSILVTVN